MSHYQTSLSFPIRRGNAYFLALRRVRTLAAIRRMMGRSVRDVFGRHVLSV